MTKLRNTKRALNQYFECYSWTQRRVYDATIIAETWNWKLCALMILKHIMISTA